ncbi:cobalt-precorrin-5B (C(1))-methyltransferase CbiD [Pseudoramibacter faecis]|uniref:cobalt-precorrin-5B (C(1))-methyltransferase CbiD n=1 Tax=Pseudoramibacter faecis TaxID=3108534 RepID=UPI002E75BBCA|nr:cobalt-precorrin-5B (C(1))-methyltransferase CbiD [Pseudoramibacter sp. HA2172]
MGKLEKYIEKGGKRMRYGYTTGSCATAASKGAATMLLSGERRDAVTIDTPRGWQLTIDLYDIEMTAEAVTCSVIKDAGDDPDVTDGMRVFATVRRQAEPGVTFKGGPGVGIVTLSGLSIPVGEPAINPTPRAMMRRELAAVARAFGYPGGFEVTIAMPEGVELAKRTFNPKLGVVGGLSVIGTSGIVTPMSEESLKASMKLELSVLQEKGYENVLYVPGNYGADFAKSLGLDLTPMIKISNFVGFMLEQAERMQVKRILFIGHLGKLIKVAGGIFQTHSAVSDARVEILAANAAWMGADRGCIDRILHCTTTDDAIPIIQEAGLDGYFDHIAQRVKKRCEAKVYGNVAIEVILFSRDYGLLGQTAGARAFKELFACTK